MAKVKSCGFLIYRTSPTLSILLMKHADRWDLPKGHVDPGETKKECAFRELEEETGITTNAIRVIPGFKFKQKYRVNGKRYKKRPQKKKLTIYLAELIQSIEIIPTEHQGYEWVEWDPPHKIQKNTIDSLLAQLAEFWQEAEGDDTPDDSRQPRTTT